MPAPVAFQPVLDALGREIATEQLEQGSILLIEDVATRFAVSRSVAREAVRMLESLGMVSIKRRVGCVVLPRDGWLVSDPRIIHWRLEGPHQSEELDQLMQVRAGIEPIAARLAAQRAPAAVGVRLRELALEMGGLAAVRLGDSPEFLAADVEFHRLILAESRNDHIAGFAPVIATVLAERNRLRLLDPRPNPAAVGLHIHIAEAIAAGDPADAEASARRLVDVVSLEVLAGSRPAVAAGQEGLAAAAP